MAETAAHLVDHVFPRVGVRQWVISFPFQIRYLLARNPKIQSRCLEIVLRAISALIKKKLRKQGATGQLQTGAVTIIQRAGGSINLNPHLHMLVLDGAYSHGEEGNPPRFHWLQSLTDDDVKVFANKDLLNGKKFTIEYLSRGGIKIDGGQKVDVLYNVEINGITYNLSHISPANWLLLKHRAKLKICADSSCTKFPEPLDKFLNNTAYLRDSEIYDWPAPHLILTGKNNSKWGYLPIVVEKSNENYMFLVLDNQSHFVHRAYDGTVIEFLGTDTDNDKAVSPYEPKHLVIDNIKFGNFGYSENDSTYLNAVFRLTKPDETPQTFSIWGSSWQ